MAEDDQVHGRLPDELAERLGQAPHSEVRHPGSGRRKSLSPLPNRTNGVCTSRMRCHGGRGRLLWELAPFMNLLPAEIILSEMKDQELLRNILLDVGRHAYSHLVKYLNSRPGTLNLGSTLNDFIPPPPNQLTTDQMVMLCECLDDAVDSIRDIANHPTFKDTSTLAVASRETIPAGLREAICVEMITPEMAATALTLLTASAFRRPPTRMVESMMAASQEAQTNSAEVDSQREGTETLDESVPPPPASDDSLLGLACSTGLWELAMLMVRVRQSGDFMGEAECTPLMEACAAGHEKIVRQMIPYSADLNTQSVTQNTALIYASAAGHLDCVQVLLEAGETRGIDLDLKNENGHCALMEAASGGHLEIVKKLIEAGSGSLRMNVNSEFKESPLTLAAYKGHRDLVAYLLTLDLGDTREEELHTALMEASMDGHIEVAKILLEAGAPVNLPSDSFESPLTLAACGGHTDLVKILLDAGASIEEPNDESYTPLMEAAREGHADVVRLLLEAGALVNQTTEETGETAMTLAACGGFTEIVEMILESGGDLEAGANTPLQEAATEGHHHTAAGIIRMMKEHGHDKDTSRLPTVTDHVSIALVQAADNGHYQIVREIATCGFVDLNYQMEGRTALMKAAKGGYRDIIRFLVSVGADVNVRSNTADVTALSLACAGGHYDSVAELLQNNADPNVILKDGVTCVLEAARHGYVHIVELLLDYRGGAGGQSGPKPNRKVATPRRTVTAARKIAAAASSTPTSSASAMTSKVAKAQLAAAQAVFSTPTAPCKPLAGTPAVLPPTAVPADGPPSAALLALAEACDVINAGTDAAKCAVAHSKSATVAAIREACAKTKDPAAQASEMMKKMGNAIPMPGKDQTLSAQQLDSFHRFHTFLVRTAKGENPPAPVISSQAHLVPAAAAATVFMADAVDAGVPRGSNSVAALASFDPASAAAAIAAAAADAATRLPHDSSTTTESSLSPSPCPSSPSLQPLMTASSDEFVSEQRAHIQVRRRSASVPHDRSNPRWPSQSMMRLHDEHMKAEAAKAFPPKKSAISEASSLEPATTRGEGAPPPSKRPTGPNRQGASRTGTVEKRPLAATSTFDVDMQTESNNDTPLTLACSNGHTAMVELLVQRGANVHHRDKKGFTPLILAATGGHLQIVQVLLDHGANIETTSERTKDTALSLACSGGKKDVAEFLLKRGANKEHRNVSDYTPLSLAASGGYVDICNMLLDAGAEINSRTGSKLGISPLMLAAMNGHKDATRVLLERGSDINAQIETNRNTALTLACFQGRTEVVRLLLQYNANVEHRAKTGLTPLMEAANGGYVDVGQLLLENYADPNASPVPSSRDTALTIAADKGHEKFVDLLLKNGAAVDARNKKGCTALWLACHGGHLDTVMTLVKYKKTNVEMEDNRKVSPLMIAFRKGHTKIVKFLVKWVAQFPGDAELCRYIQTVTEQDLMTRCHECMNTIVTAKDKQVAQANQAADALIAQIEAEEEQARSKKISKQRQKEKKKAKKQEKKKQEDSDEEDEENIVQQPQKGKKEMVKEEQKKEEEVVVSAAPTSAKTVVDSNTKATKQAAAPTLAAKGKARAAAAAAVTAAAAAAALSPPVETTPERETEKVEERIPGMSMPQPSAAPTATTVVADTAANARKTAADRRAANRRNRNESGKNSGSTTTTTTIAPAPPAPAAVASVPAQPLPSLMACPVPTPSPAPLAPPPSTSPMQQLRYPLEVQQAILSPLASPCGNSVTQEEWVKVNKKGKNARNEKTGTTSVAGVPAARSSSTSEKQKQTNPTDESALALWNNIETSRRRQQTLQVSSQCIARVIGRAGANINAIREATGASIEVERQADKSLARRDADREICIRGTEATVKNAIAMINGLIAETDITVNEIIRLVNNKGKTVRNEKTGTTSAGVPAARSSSASDKQENSRPTTTTSTTAPPPPAPAAVASVPVHPLPSLMACPVPTPSPAPLAPPPSISPMQQLRSPPPDVQQNALNEKTETASAGVPAVSSSSTSEKQLTNPTDESVIALRNNIDTHIVECEPSFPRGTLQPQYGGASAAAISAAAAAAAAASAAERNGRAGGLSRTMSTHGGANGSAGAPGSGAPQPLIPGATRHQSVGGTSSNGRSLAMWGESETASNGSGGDRGGRGDGGAAAAWGDFGSNNTWRPPSLMTLTTNGLGGVGVSKSTSTSGTQTEMGDGLGAAPGCVCMCNCGAREAARIVSRGSASPPSAQSASHSPHINSSPVHTRRDLESFQAALDSALPMRYYDPFGGFDFSNATASTLSALNLN